MLTEAEKEVLIDLRNATVSSAKVHQNIADKLFSGGYERYLPIIAGSRYEGVARWVCGDTNAMMVRKELPEVFLDWPERREDYLVAITDEDNPAYLILRPSNNWKCTRGVIKDATVTSGDTIVIGSQRFSELYDPALTPCSMGAMQRSSQTSGRAVAESEEDLDLVITACLLSPGWPDCASDFITRNRSHSWPPQKLIEKIHHAGCHVVSDGDPQSANRQIEWRWSFSVAEKELMHEMNDDMYLVMCFLKAYTMKRRFNNDRPTSLCSYFIKTACLWVCEETEPTNITSLCREVIDWLLTSYRMQHFPHYFIPEQNLIGHLQQDRCEEVINWLKDLNNDLSRIQWGDIIFGSPHPLPSNKMPGVSVSAAVRSENVSAEISGLCVMEIDRLITLIPVSYSAPSLITAAAFQKLFGQVLSDLSVVTPYSVPLHTSVIHRGVGDHLSVLHAYHRKLSAEGTVTSVTFTASEDTVYEMKTDDRFEEFMYSQIVQHYTEGLEMVYPDGWSDRGVGGWVRLATFYHLNGERDKLGETLRQLEPLLGWAMGQNAPQLILPIMLCTQDDIKMAPWKQDPLLHTHLTRSWEPDHMLLHPVSLGCYLKAKWIADAVVKPKRPSDLDTSPRDPIAACFEAISDNKTGLKYIISMLDGFQQKLTYDPELIASTKRLVCAIGMLIPCVKNYIEPDLN